MTASLQVVSPSAQVDLGEAEFAKDIWDVRNIPGAHYAAHLSNHLLNFTGVPSPFRAVTKRYIRLRLTQHSQQDCSQRLRYVQLFLEFFTARYSGKDTLQSLNRADIEAYLFAGGKKSVSCTFGELSTHSGTF